MDKSLISIIIPTYNRADMLDNSINSVRKQTYKNWELIIVDDASTDRTEDVIRKHMAEDARIRYIKNDTNTGANATRNRGIKESSGEYIAFLDDDDRWDPDKISLQYNYFMENPVIGVVYCGYRYINLNTEKIVRIESPRYVGDVSVILLRNNFIGSSVPLFKRECFDIAGQFDEELTSCQDWDMWIRIAQVFHFSYINKVLVDITVHGHQISVNLKSKIESRHKLLKKYEYLLKKNRPMLAHYCKRLAILYTLDHAPLKTIRYLLRAIIINPMEIEYMMHLLLSLIPPLHRSTIKQFGLFHHDGITFYN